jgi:HlyD family secretion protein
MYKLALVVITLAIVSCAKKQPEALGTLERDRIAHTATAAEVIVELPVQQGDPVTVGTVLVRLDSTLQQARTEHARADVARAEAQLDKLRNGARVEEVAAAQAEVVGARANLIEAEHAFKRQKSLMLRELTSQANLDKKRATRDSVSAKLISTQEQLRKLTNGTREEDLRMGESELAAARALLANETKLLSDLTITASRNGILDNLPWNLGERVSIGSPVAVVLAGAVPYARVYIPEPWRVQITIGTELTVQIDGIDDAFPGTVRWISHEPAFTPYYALNQSERSRLVYLAEVQLTADASDLPSGVPAQVLLP